MSFKKIFEKSKILLVSFCILILLSVLTLTFILSWFKIPEIYLIESSNYYNLITQFINAPMHLSDDVMISLRSGYIFNDTGIPAFNRSDLANPSTSYLAPYLYSILCSYLPLNISVFIYSIIGFGLVLLSLTMLVKSSKSKLVGLAAAILIIFTSTAKLYSLNGWDHLFQSSMFLFAINRFMRSKLDLKSIISITILCFLGTGFRPDGIVISIGIIFSIYLKVAKKKFLLISLSLYSSLFGTLLLSNYSYFGYFTPTTTRLKLGINLTFKEMIKYVIDNGIYQFSAITLLLIFIIYYLKQTYRREMPNYSHPIFIACVFTAVYAFLVSDVFSGGRMFYSPAIITIYMCIRFIPESQPLRKFEDEVKNLSNRLRSKILNDSTFFAILVIAIIIVGSLHQVRYNIATNANIARAKDNNSATYQQFRVANWIEKNLNPADGAIGVYWLGVGFHLKDFDIADFLGKADEMIASENSRFGPPGHNKWNTSKSIQKWNPQLIIPPVQNMLDISVLEAKIWIDEKRAWGFVPDLRLNSNIDSSYKYCLIRSLDNETMNTSWRVYVRYDISKKYYFQFKCDSLN